MSPARTQKAIEHEGDSVDERRLDAVNKVAGERNPEKAIFSPELVIDAMDWFAEADDEEVPEDDIYWLDLNVGKPGKPKWIRWGLRGVDRSVIDAAAEGPEGNRSQRRGQAAPTGPKNSTVNMRLALAGTASFDVTSEAFRKHGGTTYADPADALRSRFRAKPGLIDQIANTVMELSGFDEMDVREATEAEVATAGN